MKLLLDSVILIDHFNDISKATHFIEEQRNNIHLSVITRAEILVGFNAKSEMPAKLFLDHFPTLPIMKDDADLAADLRRMFRWKLPDALQAAIAKNHKLKLVTRNTKDFDPKEHHFILIPYNFP